MRNGENMRLYKTELYKLCHRKIFIMGILAMVGILFIDYGDIKGMSAYIDGMEYGYSQAGWNLFNVDYSVTMMVLGVVLLCIVSTVFSHEEQTGMKPLLLTTHKGPDQDALAKIAAAYTVSIGFWLVTTLILLLMHITCSGLSGLELNAGDVLWHNNSGFEIFAQPLGLYLTEVILLSFLAVLELCAITLAVSAEYSSTFHSLCGSAIFCIFVPVLALYMLRGSFRFYLAALSGPKAIMIVLSILFLVFQCLMYSAPFYLVYPDILVEISSLSPGNHGETAIILFVVALGCIVTILCIVKSYRRYRKPYHF